MSRNHRDPLASSLRGRLVALVVVLLALLAGWLLFGRSSGDELDHPKATIALPNQPVTHPPTSPRPPVTHPPTAPPPSPPSSASLDDPYGILLPQIGMSARVIPIVAKGGSLSPHVVGWWRDGVRPGAETGSAVMTAHTVHTGGGAFDDLGKLRIGATVTVRSSSGRVGYVVMSVTNYPKRSLAKHSAELFDQTVRGRLVLVTCDDWNGKVYLSNTVVIAEPPR
jgi:LPXTG-site transpeptidase (sortase) family protein